MSNFPEGLRLKKQKREVLVEKITVAIAVERPGAGDRLMKSMLNLFGSDELDWWDR